MAIAAKAYDTIYERAELRYRLALADGVSAAIAPFRCSGFVTANEPGLVATRIQFFLRYRSDSQRLLDLGCGTGVLGAAVARRLGVRFAGVDFSPAAIRLARMYTPDGGFAVATFDSLPFRDRSIAAVMSHDALYLGVSDSALSEIARVTSGGAPIAFSTYVSSLVPTWSVCTWREKLLEHGLRVRSVIDDTRRWRRVMQRRHRTRWQQRDRLLATLGVDIEPELVVSARMIGADGSSPFIASTSRFYIVATRS